MLCGVIPQHATAWSRAHLVPRTSSCISTGGGGVKHNPNTEGSSITALMHRFASKRPIYSDPITPLMGTCLAKDAAVLSIFITFIASHVPSFKQVNIPVQKYHLKMPERLCWWPFCTRPLLFPQHWLRDVMETLRLSHFLASIPCCQIDQNTFTDKLLLITRWSVIIKRNAW